MNDEVIQLKFCLVLGAALRDSYRLRRENPRPIVRMIKTLNNFSHKEGQDEIIIFILEMRRLRGRIDNSVYIHEYVQGGESKIW